MTIVELDTALDKHSGLLTIYELHYAVDHHRFSYSKDGGNTFLDFEGPTPTAAMIKCLSYLAVHPEASNLSRHE